MKQILIFKKGSISVEDKAAVIASGNVVIEVESMAYLLAQITIPDTTEIPASILTRAAVKAMAQEGGAALFSFIRALDWMMDQEASKEAKP